MMANWRCLRRENLSRPVNQTYYSLLCQSRLQSVGCVQPFFEYNQYRSVPSYHLSLTNMLMFNLTSLPISSSQHPTRWSWGHTSLGHFPGSSKSNVWAWFTRRCVDLWDRQARASEVFSAGCSLSSITARIPSSTVQRRPEVAQPLWG